MIILAVDTSTNVASCAIMDDEKLLGEFLVNDSVTHSQKLLPLISQALDACKLKVSDIDIFAAASGPGSFTGLRIGVATINGLAQSVEKPVVAVSSLKALAESVRYSEKLIVPLIDARRDRVFASVYRSTNGELEAVMKPDVVELDELMNILEKEEKAALFTGEGIDAYREKIESRLKDKAHFTDKAISISRASQVAELAFRDAQMGNTLSYFEMVPDYLRESQAQREYDERQRLER